MSDRAPIEIRSATVAAVDYPERTLSIIVAPYDEWAVVERAGKAIEESIAPGAFGAIRNRARKFTVNMEHDRDRWIGSVIDLDTDEPTGLLATVKVRRTPDGDQALNDAADELLGASIGMAVAPSGERYEGNRRRISKAFLDHIALTSMPAYVGARVLEVRHSLPSSPGPSSSSSTPNLDRVLADRLAASYSRL
jgi:HK97 family phage prohead protease